MIKTYPIKFTVAAALAMSLCACSYIPKVTEVNIDGEEVSVVVGHTASIQAAYVTEDQQEGFQAPAFQTVETPSVTVNYEADQPGIVMVDAKGNIAGLKPGKTFITVTASGAESSVSDTIDIICYEHFDDLDDVPDTLEIKVGETYDFETLCGEYVVWNAIVKTSDEAIVSVDGSELKAEASGDAVVTLTLNKDVKEVAVKAVELITGFSLNNETLDGTVGATATIGMGAFQPETANGGLELKFSTSHEEIVTVDEDGTVHFIAPGEAVIYAENEYGIKAECKVTVSEASYSKPATGSPMFVTASGFYDINGNKVGDLPSSGRNSSNSYSGKSGSTSASDYNPTDAGAKAALKMVGGNYKCTQIAEASAKAHGKTAWRDAVINGQRGQILDPEGFLKIGKKVSSPSPGDVLYYSDGGFGYSHVAVYLDKGMAVHGNWNGNGSTVIRSAYYRTPTYIISLD